MLFDMRFSRFFSMMSSIAGVSARSVCVMRCFLMMAAFMVFRGLLMMVRGMPMVLWGFLVMFRCILWHALLLPVPVSVAAMAVMVAKKAVNAQSAKSAIEAPAPLDLLGRRTLRTFREDCATFHGWLIGLNGLPLSAPAISIGRVCVWTEPLGLIQLGLPATFRTSDHEVFQKKSIVLRRQQMTAIDARDWFVIQFIGFWSRYPHELV
jgi:hypothetical protein